MLGASTLLVSFKVYMNLYTLPVVRLSALVDAASAVCQADVAACKLYGKLQPVKALLSLHAGSTQEPKPSCTLLRFMISFLLDLSI